MRWRLWATAVAAYAAELRLETFVTVELTLDNLPLTLRAHVDDDPLVAVRREELLRVRRRELWDCCGIHRRVEAVGRREHLGYDGARAPRLLVGARDRGSVESFDGAGYGELAPMLLRGCIDANVDAGLMLALPSSTATDDANLLVGTRGVVRRAANAVARGRRAAKAVRAARPPPRSR